MSDGERYMNSGEEADADGHEEEVIKDKVIVDAIEEDEEDIFGRDEEEIEQKKRRKMFLREKVGNIDLEENLDTLDSDEEYNPFVDIFYEKSPIRWKTTSSTIDDFSGGYGCAFHSDNEYDPLEIPDEEIPVPWKMTSSTTDHLYGGHGNQSLTNHTKQTGLCRLCGLNQTHMDFYFSGSSQDPVWKPIVEQSNIFGNITVYKGYCTRPSCYASVDLVKLLLGEASALSGQQLEDFLQGKMKDKQ